VALGALVFSVCAVASAPPRVQLPLVIYDQNAGLSSLSVVRLLEDERHFVWAGTEQGLYRFDGIGFNPMLARDGFQTSEVVSLAEDDQGRVWAGTRAGLQQEDGEGQFSWVRPEGRTMLVDRGQTLASDGQGGMLAVTGHHLFRLTRRASGQWMAAPWPERMAGPGEAPQVAAVYRARGEIWFGCDEAICRVRTGVLTRFGANRGVPADKWVGFLVSRDGAVWARGLRTVLALPAGDPEFIRHDIPGTHGEVAASSIDLAQDRDGRILTRSDTGIARWDGGQWELLDSHNGLPGVGMSALIADHDGAIWGGTYGRGVLYWGNVGAVENWTANQGLSDSLIWSITRAGSDAIWVAGESGGEIIVPSEGRAHRWATGLPPPIQAHAVLASPGGAIWYFLFDGRVIRSDPSAQKASQVAELPYLIRGAYQDRAGRLWVYTMGGLYQLDPATGAAEHVAPDLIPSTMCSDLAEDHAGRLWLACNSGLYRHNESGWAHVRVAPEESAGGYENVAATPDGRLWLSALQPGLLAGRTGDNDTVTMTPVDDPLLATTRFYFLRADGQGRIWAGGGKGVDVLANGTWTRLSSRDGLLWDETNHGAFFADADGSVWMGTPIGLTHVLKPTDLLAPRVMDPRLLPARYGEHPVTSEPLPYEGGAPLQVAFGVAGNSAGHPVHFRYRLSPLDRDWVDTSQREVRYASLPWGHYRFQVQVVDENRRMASDAVAFEVTIQPPWWMAPWAFIALALAIVGIAVALWRWRTRVLIAHARRLEGIVVERTAELQRLLHARRRLLAHIGHDLRSPLSAIVNVARQWRWSAQDAEPPQKIERHARMLMELIDEVVEFSRGELTDVQIEPTPGYLFRFLYGVADEGTLLAQSNGNQLETRLDPALPAVVELDFRRLRQVLSNLIGNAAKYTRHGQIVFIVDRRHPVSATSCRLTFAVEDTGIGLGDADTDSLLEPFIRGSNTEGAPGSGLGLAIVTQLLLRMGSQLQVESRSTGQGSRFSFEIEVALAHEGDLEPDLPHSQEPVDVEGQGRVVAVVEPDAVRRAVLCDLLDGYGFESVPLASMADWDELVPERLALLVIEPHGHGEEEGTILARVHRMASQVPVLALTSVPLATMSDSLSMVEVLLKPSDDSEFMASVVRLLEGSRRSVRRHSAGATDGPSPRAKGVRPA
jgi:signal transduction histidine kinase/ligand-binding sensor domain-containing protein